jgi:hypothetical protein
MKKKVVAKQARLQERITKLMTKKSGMTADGTMGTMSYYGGLENRDILDRLGSAGADLPKYKLALQEIKKGNAEKANLLGKMAFEGISKPTGASISSTQYIQEDFFKAVKLLKRYNKLQDKLDS